MITSASNDEVKSLLRLQKKSRERRERGLFIVEGLRAFKEIPPERIEKIYVTDTFLASFRPPDFDGRQTEPVLWPEAAKLIAGHAFTVLSDQVFARVSDTQTPQGILAVVRMAEASPDELFADDCGLWLMLEGIQDPGNLGTMFRTAEGAGIGGIIMDGNTADIYNPKTVRSTMGSIFRVPFMVMEDLSGAVSALKSRGVRIFAACGGGDLTYADADFSSAAAILIGNEGNGLSPRMQEMADERISIPMRGRLESLNASIAAAILMYEADRQRRAL